MVPFDLMQNMVLPAVGGIIIGLAVTLMLLWNGRVTGIAGIANGLLSFEKGDMLWRFKFVIGLALGGFVLSQFHPEAFIDESGRTIAQIGVAGVIVGFGTVMGSGCTSGHGVCGISRMSARSIVATIAFMGAGFASAYFFRQWLGGGGV